MTSIGLEIEVILIFAATVLFILFIFPVPFLSAGVARLLSYLETVRIAGVSVPVLVSLITTINFAWTYYNYVEKYREPVKHIDHKMALDFHNKKWRNERNMYMHALATVLIAALMKFTKMTRQAAAAPRPTSPSDAKDKRE